MNEETKLPDGLQLAIRYCNIGTTHDRRNFAEDAIRSEHAQRPNGVTVESIAEARKLLGLGEVKE